MAPAAVSLRKLDALAVAAAKSQTKAVGAQVTCAYLGQPFGPKRSRNYRRDPSNWKVSEGGRRSQQTVVFRWTFNEQEFLVEQLAKHAVARGVRVPALLPPVPQQQIEVNLSNLELLATTAANEQAAALDDDVACIYLGQPFGPKSSRKYRRDPSTWKLSEGSRRSQATVAFRWTWDEQECLVEQLVNHAVARGVRVPALLPPVPQQQIEVNLSNLELLATTAANEQAAALDDDVACIYLGQPFGPKSSRKYRRDPSTWKLSEGSRRSQATVAFRWTWDEQECLVEQQVKNAVARGVRVPSLFPSAPRLQIEVTSCRLELLAAEAARKQTAALGVDVACIYLGQPCGGKQSADYKRDPDTWKLSKGSRRSQATVAFRWIYEEQEFLVEQLVNHAVDRGVRVPSSFPSAPRQQTEVSSSRLDLLATEASSQQIAALGMVVSCVYLGQPFGRKKSREYRRDPTTWKLSKGSSRNETAIAFRWIFEEQEFLVEQLVKNVLARGVRSPPSFLAFPLIGHLQERAADAAREQCRPDSGLLVSCRFVGVARGEPGSQAVGGFDLDKLCNDADVAFDWALNGEHAGVVIQSLKPLKLHWCRPLSSAVLVPERVWSAVRVIDLDGIAAEIANTVNRTLYTWQEHANQHFEGKAVVGHVRCTYLGENNDEDLKSKYKVATAMTEKGHNYGLSTESFDFSRYCFNRVPERSDKLTSCWYSLSADGFKTWLRCYEIHASSRLTVQEDFRCIVKQVYAFRVEGSRCQEAFFEKFCNVKKLRSYYPHRDIKWTDLSELGNLTWRFHVQQVHGQYRYREDEGKAYWKRRRLDYQEK